VRALLSVYDKRGIADFAKGLAELGFELVSTSGTAEVLRKAGLKVRAVEEVTGFPEFLGGCVKTLHPAIHGGILARRDESHLAELREQGITPIDLVAVNLYPFAETVARPGATLAEAIEQIDIGGVALLRAAAKNFQAVVVISDPDDYGMVLRELRLRGEVPLEIREYLALKAFRQTASYDIAIGNYLSSLFEGDEALPSRLQLDLIKLQDLRYGENPHQRAAFYISGEVEGPLGGRLLQGRGLSYNNVLDLDAAWQLISEFNEPTLVIIKHGNPCGVASGEGLAGAFQAALACDPTSAFGCVIAANRLFDGEVASALEGLFVEAIAAPAFTPEALAILSKRPQCRLLEITGGAKATSSPFLEVRSVQDGFLLQERDTLVEDEGRWRVVTKREPTAEEMEGLRFAWKVVKHVKSNAIVLAKQGSGQTVPCKQTRHLATVGIGAGQMSRVDAVRLAVMKAGERARGAVLASDAFFPFPDGVEEAAEGGVTAIIQPGGSIRDEEVIEAANSHGLAMVFTGFRHFRH